MPFVMFLFFLYCSQLPHSEYLTFWASAKEYKCLKECPGSGWRVRGVSVGTLNWGIPLTVTSVLYRLGFRSSTNHGSLTVWDDNWSTHHTAENPYILTPFVVTLLNCRLSTHLAWWRLSFLEGIFNHSKCRLFISWIVENALIYFNIYFLISVCTAKIAEKKNQIAWLEENIKKGNEALADLQKQNESSKKHCDAWVWKSLNSELWLALRKSVRKEKICVGVFWQQWC